MHKMPYSTSYLQITDAAAWGTQLQTLKLSVNSSDISRHVSSEHGEVESEALAVLSIAPIRSITHGSQF